MDIPSTESDWGDGAVEVCFDTSVPGSDDGLPETYVLKQNHPNPFNPSTEICFALPMTSHVRLEIFNIAGQKVGTLIDGHLNAGHHTATWDGGDVSSGVYLYRLQAGVFDDTKKMILLK